MSGVKSKHFWVEFGANVTINTLILSVLHWALTHFVKNTVGIYVHYCIQKIKPSSQNAYMTGIITPGEEYWPNCSRKYSGVSGAWQQRTRGNCTLRSFTICTLHQINVQINNDMGRTGSSMEKRCGAYRVLVWKPEGKRPLETPRRTWEFEWILKKSVGGARNGLSWFRIEISNGILWTR